MKPFITVAILALTLSAETAPPAGSSDGLQILKRVAQHYADAKSYYMEATQEELFHNDYERSWRKMLMTAAEAPGNRFHYEGHSGGGSALRIADGKTVWSYHIDEHRYTHKPASPKPSGSTPTIMTMEEDAMLRAEQLRKELADVAKHFKSATRLPDAKMRVDGRDTSCYVVRVRTSDQKRVQPDYSFEKTFWIDKQSETVVKTFETTNTYMLSGSARIPIHEQQTTMYHVQLGTTIPDSVFTFVPPPDAKLIADFPDPMKSHGGPDLSGEQAPALVLTSADNKRVSLDSFRGKPVLLDIWATWCQPCITNMPQLAHVYADAKEKGLVLLSIDQDEDANTATDFLASKQYTWPNFHDTGDVSKLLGGSPIPRTILIDAKGKIVADMIDPHERDLRAAIAKLSPEYASLAPKPEPAPCSVAK